MMTREQRTVRKLFRELLRAPLHTFPYHRESVDAPNQQGIYLIMPASGK
jgi:hypothetical protein